MGEVSNLTYEEFETLLIKIEALLNSRPLHQNPLTPCDEPALTPFHFINQRGYKPTALDSSVKVPLTKKWLMIKEIQNQFWHKFQTNYLIELQTKIKWQTPQRNLQINELVLIKEPSITPAHWKMGKVVTTYPDPQGTVRKVQVQTAACKEPTLHAVNRLVPLLLENEPETTQEPRRSTRLQRKLSVILLCLMALLTFSTAVNCEEVKSVEQLEPGIHLKRLGDVYKKAFNLEFSVVTNLNLTEDIRLIQNSAHEFLKECEELKKLNETITNHCLTLHSSLKALTSQISEDLRIHFEKKRIEKVKRRRR